MACTFLSCEFLQQSACFHVEGLLKTDKKDDVLESTGCATLNCFRPDLKKKRLSPLFSFSFFLL